MPALAVFFGAAVWGPATAQWDLSSSASLRSTWADNVDYSSSSSPRFCDPSLTSKQCNARGPDGDVVNEVRLSGNVLREGDRWRMDATYAPTGSFYRDRTGLNRLAHLGRLRSDWQLSARTRLTITDTFSYTPDQGTTGDNFQSAIVLTEFTDRRSNRATARLGMQLSRASTLDLQLEHNVQSYSERTLTDFTGTGLSARWTHELSTRSGLDATARASTNRFSRVVDEGRDTDPTTYEAFTLRSESRTYSVGAGGRLGFGERMTARGLLGLNYADPLTGGRQPRGQGQDTSARHGTRVEAGLLWSGRLIVVDTGYQQQLTAGTGTFAVSRTETWFSGVRATFGRLLRGSLYANQSQSRAATGGSGEEPLTRSGTASLDLDVSSGITGGLFYSRNVQWSEHSVEEQRPAGTATVTRRDKRDDWRFGLSLTARFN